MNRRVVISRRQWLLSTAAATGHLAFSRAIEARGEAQAEKQLKVLSKSPFNAEPDLEELARLQITPVPHFYVRNHGPIPKIDAKSFRLTVEGLVKRTLTLTLEDLQGSFDQHAAEATLTCAGNRRSEMSAIKKVDGVHWNAGAVGNAMWRGTMLGDLLKAAEVRPEARHVWFEGLDPIKEKDGSETPFGGSIPLDKAMETRPGLATLAAWSMNDEPLKAEHGFPLRMVVPGYIGARSVKWLNKIIVSDRPSSNHFVAEAYKIIQSSDKAEVATAEPIYEFPINAAICTPALGAKPRPGKLTVAGYALPPGDSKSTIGKVELSLDGGQSWSPAELKGKARPMVWQLWSADVEITPKVKGLVVRAIDSQGRTQPETPAWNLKGYLYNGWHRVEL